MKQPLVSVVIPLFNRELLISTPVESLLAQTYTNWEAVIIDDGSTDRSVEIVEKFVEQDPRIRLLRRDREPKGASTCRNIGVVNSFGEYILFLDSDDYLETHCLETRIRLFIENPSFDFLVFNMRILYENSREEKYWNISQSDNEDDLSRFLRGDGVWSITGPIYKRKILNQYKFKEDLPFWQDYIFHINLLAGELKYRKYLEIVDSVNIRHSHESISQLGFENESKQLQKLQILGSVFLQLKREKKLDYYITPLTIHYLKTLFLIRKKFNSQIVFEKYSKVLGISGKNKVNFYTLFVYFLAGSQSKKIHFKVLYYFVRFFLLGNKQLQLVNKPKYLCRVSLNG